MNETATVAIVGGGLVGALNAIYFAQRGWNVVVYELRPDIRLEENKAEQRGKSINLALSERGLSALRALNLGLEEEILNAALPMHARMVHIGKEGKQLSQAYSVHGEHINAVDRARLNVLLLDAAEKIANITIHFQHRLLSADLEQGKLTFDVAGTTVTHEADLIIGADGAHSKTRTQMMRQLRMNYQQEYIDTAYCELSMPPLVGKDGQHEFALSPNHLHIWPRHTFMLIALPNPDRTFTCTLFMPFEMFDHINSEQKLMELFTEHFNDAIPLIGESRLKREYFENPRGSLISVKVSPHNLKDKAVIVGDAAHAMVPFYGQGMNCGFQDVEVLHRILDRHKIRPIKLKKDGGIPGLLDALNEYSNERVKDCYAISDLAMYNHYEMRSAVTSYRYLARKKLEGLIHYYFPRLVIPLYTMVSFTTMPYSKAIERWHRQSFWLNTAMAATAVATLATTAVVGLRFNAKPQAVSTRDTLFRVLTQSKDVVFKQLWGSRA